MSSDLKPSQHCSEVFKTANKLVGFIGRAFNNKSDKVLMNLYSLLVRPHLEWFVEVWSPYYRKDKTKNREMQSKITKIIPRLANLPYEERLKGLDVLSLTKLRMRGGLIERLKLSKGFDIIVQDDFTADGSNITKRHNSFNMTGKRLSPLPSSIRFLISVILYSPVLSIL